MKEAKDVCLVCTVQQKVKLFVILNNVLRDLHNIPQQRDALVSLKA